MAKNAIIPYLFAYFNTFRNFVPTLFNINHRLYLFLP